MPAMNSRRVQITLYIEPETYRKLDEGRNPKLSRSEYFTNMLTNAIGLKA